MPINVVPSTPEEKVLLIIGDSGEDLITSSVITYILSVNDDDINKAAIEATKYIIASLAKKVDEEVGDIKVKFSQLLENYKKLLKDLLSNPAYQLAASNFIFGGTSKTEIDRVRGTPDSNLPPLKEGFFTKDGSEKHISTQSYYYLDCD
jgi:hypothetical protein